MLTHLSLFSGIGGLDLAAEWAGIQTVGQCEWADFPTRVLEKHWPDVPRWRDIRTLTKEDFHARTGLRTVDIVSGGFPCQPFSIAGKRRGKADDRYLWDEMLRVIHEIRPSWVVGENVAGLISMAQPNGEPILESRQLARNPEADCYEAVFSRQENLLLPGIIENLYNIGYDVQTFVIPACGVGAAHQRYRVAIVAHAEGAGGRRIPVQPGRSQQTHADADRSCEAMADADSTQWGAEHKEYIGLEEQSHGLQKRPESANRPGCCREDLADPQSTMRNRIRAKSKGTQSRPTDFGRRPAQSRLGLPSDGLSGWVAGSSGAGWQSGPINAWDCDWDNIPRLSTGDKDRVAMLTALGNAVVPQQFYPIFAAIATIMAGGIP